MGIRYGVEISSFVWCGSLNAEHYYGELWSYDESKPFGKAIWKEELVQPMTKKMAAYLNKKDSSHFDYGYKKGDETKRFDAEEDVVKHAIKVLTAKFGDNITIEEGSLCDCENKVIYGESQ